MARLPKKPGNIVHEFFPVGTDGHSPMNKGAFDVYKELKEKDKDEDGDTLFNKNDDTMLYEIGPKQVSEGPSASEVEKDETEKAKKKQEQKDAWKKTKFPTMALKKTVRTVASGRLKSAKKKKAEKKKMHISADLSNLTKDQKKTVVKAGRGDKGGYNTKGSADLAASGLKASNELKNLRR